MEFKQLSLAQSAREDCERNYGKTALESLIKKQKERSRRNSMKSLKRERTKNPDGRRR